jgi:uncharacterized protein (DUF885 family)
LILDCTAKAGQESKPLNIFENEAESEASITTEIERYMAIPGQALSYKIDS